MIKASRNIVSDLFIEKKYKIFRHVLLLGLITIVTLNFLWYLSVNNVPAYYKIYAWILYFILFIGLIYVNIYIAVPRLLFHNKLCQYTLFLIVSITIALLSVGFIQIFLLGVEASISRHLWESIINIASAIIIIGFLLMGTSTLLLVKHKIISDIEKVELESSILETELNLLKNQINPHFLFNMINNVNGLLQKDKILASETLFKLENLLEYQIYKNTKEAVTLGTEVNFIKDYLNLEKIRRDNFEYSVKEEDSCRQIEVSPLLFINFVENAVKYSIILEGISYVNVSFCYIDSKLIFKCENSMSEYPVQSNNTSGLGLKNIRRRLDLLYPNLHNLIIEENNSKYIVKLIIEI